VEEFFALIKFMKRTQANACLICYYFSVASINKFNIPGSWQRFARALHSNTSEGKCKALVSAPSSQMQNSNYSNFAFKSG